MSDADETLREQDAERELDNVELGTDEEAVTAPPTREQLLENDSRLVTQASLAAILGVTTEVIDQLAGNGLTLAQADGTIPSRADIRKLVTKAVYAGASKRAVKFEHTTTGDL